MSSDIMRKFWSAPPVTRTIVAAMFAESALVHGGVVHGHRVILYSPWIFKLPPELWRLLSSFLLTGGGFSFVFDLYFMWTYGTGLELNSPRFTQPGDFFVYVVFVATVILPFLAEAVPGFEGDYPCGTCSSIIRKAIKDCMRHGRGGGFFENAMRNTIICVRRLWLPTSIPTYFLHFNGCYHTCDDDRANETKGTAGLCLNAVVLTSSLLLAFIYTFAQDNRGKKAHFIIFQIPVELLPWAMLTLTLIMGGPTAALQQGTGVLAAHLYDFLTRLYPTFQGGKNIIQTPTAVRGYFGSSQGQYTNRGYGQAFRPPQANQQAQSRGWSSGFSNSWTGRGTGRRLGGD